ASGTLLAAAWVATMLSYCARLCALAPDETNSATVAASQTNFGKFFIKTISADGRRNEWFLRLVPSAGQDVAKTGRDRGEMSAAHACVNKCSQRDPDVICAMHRFCRREVRHADAQECRAKVAVKV